MKDKLSREEVLHVAELARISLTEEEIEKYQVELKELLNDVVRSLVIILSFKAIGKPNKILSTSLFSNSFACFSASY